MTLSRLRMDNLVHPVSVSTSLSEQVENEPSENGDSTAVGSILQDDTNAGIAFKLHNDGSKTWYFRRLVWSTAGPDEYQWTPAEWQWEAYDRDRDCRKHSVLHGDGIKTLGNDVHDSPPVSCISPGVHVPAEILLCIVEYVTGCAQAVKANLCLASLDEICAEDSDSSALPERIEPWATGHWHNIAGIALACRKWFEQYAPLVFSKIYVDESRIDEFYECIMLPNSAIRTHARSLAIRGPQPWPMAARISAMLPHLTFFDCSAYHRSYNHVLKAPNVPSSVRNATIASAGLRILSIGNCRFESAAQFARLVRLFPSLFVLALDAVSFEPSSSTSGSTTTLDSGTSESLDHIRPSTVVLNLPKQDTILAVLSLWPTIPVHSTGVDMLASGGGQFRLVSDSELDYLTNHIAIMTAKTFVLRLEPCSIHADTWVLWIAAYYADSDESAMMSEFHISCSTSSQDNSTTLITAPESLNDLPVGYIRHIVLRDASHLLPSHLSTIELREEVFGDLPHVQTITLEPKDTHPENAEEREFLDKLRSGAGKLRHRTWKEAYEATLEATTNGAVDKDRPISPLWASPRHKAMRDRYLESLKKTNSPK